LAESPLPCLLVCLKNNGFIYSFSLNGELISKDETPKNIIDISIGQDTNFADYLVYLDRTDGSLVGKKTPFLEDKILIIKKQGTAFALFDNKRMAVIGDNSGDFTFIWSPHCINAS